MEKFSQWTQKLVGLNSVFWGKTFIVYYGADTTITMLMNWTWWCLLFLPFVGWVFYRVFQGLEIKKVLIGEVITANIFKLVLRPLRVYSMVLFPFDVYQSFLRGRPSAEIGLTLAIFFLSVDDLPSQPSKLRVWLESLFTPDPLPSEGSARSYNG